MLGELSANSGPIFFTLIALYNFTANAIYRHWPSNYNCPWSLQHHCTLLEHHRPYCTV
jgi:hypothetical protein